MRFCYHDKQVKYLPAAEAEVFCGYYGKRQGSSADIMVKGRTGKEKYSILPVSQEQIIAMRGSFPEQDMWTCGRLPQARSRERR